MTNHPVLGEGLASRESVTASEAVGLDGLRSAGRANLSGVDWSLLATHVDPILTEGEHSHVWTVTAWWPSEPWQDGRAMRHALSVVVEGLAPQRAGGYRHLHADLWTGEAIAAAVLALLTPPPVRVDVDRPGFHVERWA